jgi:glycerophosphoryl diester phosphodiesterase
MSIPPRPTFELQGHRGARGLFPENTLEGIAATLALGVDAIELDIAVTADGVAVVFHDVALNPDIARDETGAWIAGPGKLIRDLAWAEISRFDVGRLRPGSKTAARHAGQTPHDGARIPTLAAVLALTVAVGARVDAELKTLPARPEATVSPASMADIVIAAAEAAGAMALLDLRSFDWRGLAHAHACRPELPRTWLTSPDTVAQAELWWGIPRTGSVAEAVARAGGGTWAPEHVGLTEADIAEAHACGLRVVPWTVNAPADMARLIDWGVDGLCTDRPDIARRVMAERGMPLPPSRNAVSEQP